jgi:hypothetical protein
MTWTRAGAFAQVGVRLRNNQWSWSGRSEDGQAVAITVWTDKVKREDDSFVYRQIAYTEAERGRPGFRELIENLRWARDHCGGLVKIVMTTAKDDKANPREVERCYPVTDQRRLQLVDVDYETGAHVAKMVTV